VTYWDWVVQEARKVRTDGCSHVADVHVECCYEHDLAYRTGRCPRSAFNVGWANAIGITKESADARFRSCIQRRSILGKWSPMSWWRWAGVSVFGEMSSRPEYWLSLLTELDGEDIIVTK
jgi:hypothetical protein